VDDACCGVQSIDLGHPNPVVGHSGVGCGVVNTHGEAVIMRGVGARHED
jgi:hypothetical protein